jgi:hypothetical protein
MDDTRLGKYPHLAYSFDCFACEREMPDEDRRFITLRILGEAQSVGICADCKYSVAARDLWKRVEEIEQYFFLKRLANPFYGWENYWDEHYAIKKKEQENRDAIIRKVTKPRPPRWNE